MIQLFEGAMGTMLQQSGLQPGSCPELWNIEKPEIITKIHRQYIESGADIVESNTFGANRIKLAHYGLSEKVAQINTAAVNAARQALGPNTKIAGSVGPTGKFIAPLGDLDFDTAYDVFLEQITALDTAGVDKIIIETIIDIQEMRAALLAARKVTNKPVICQLSFGADGRTLTGTDPKTAALILEAMGADIIGANCSLGPAQLLPIAEQFAQTTTLPISIQPNAGMPKLIKGNTIFPMNPAEMGSWVPRLIAAGVSYLGGCCGTTPEHIKAMHDAIYVDHLETTTHDHSSFKYQTALTSRSKYIFLGPSFPKAIIGERINPTGRKLLRADIQEGHFTTVKKEALGQLQAGANILDVNMGVPGIDPAETMTKAIHELSLLVNAPLAIDTTDPAALEAGLKAYPGRALVNSVSAEPERLESFLPLAKKYGAAVLCLPLAAGGVPKTAKEKVTIIKEIQKAAFSAGLKPHDLLLDALVLTVAADENAAKETLATLQLYRQEFGYPTIMGLSNISYGLPRRDLLNAAFCAMSLASGLDAPILNPYDSLMKDILNASSALLGDDAAGKNFSMSFANTSQSVQPSPVTNTDNIIAAIKQTVLNGEKEAVAPLILKALEQKYQPVEITEQGLTAAMNEIGVAFGSGRCFLPQVMLAAETMRVAFLTIKEAIPSLTNLSIGTAVLATVKGDIHDLGKNIVAALMENSGFRIIDLGKDVLAEKIVETAIQENADIVGLCALMTTTMPQIDNTIAELKKQNCNAKIIVGGAVLTEEYANKAGADAYAANGVDAVNIAKNFLSNKQ